MTNRCFTEHYGIWTKTWQRAYYKTILSGVFFYCSEHKIKAFVKLTFKMSLYHDVGNEYAIIQANRCMSYNPTLTESLYVTSTFYLTITATCQVSDFDCNSTDLYALDCCLRVQGR